MDEERICIKCNCKFAPRPLEAVDLCHECDEFIEDEVDNGFPPDTI
jgi:hypothetical protein